MKKDVKMYILVIGIVGAIKYLLIPVLAWLWTEILLPLLAGIVYFIGTNLPIVILALIYSMLKGEDKARFRDMMFFSWIFSKRK